MFVVNKCHEKDKPAMKVFIVYGQSSVLKRKTINSGICQLKDKQIITLS